MLLALSDYGLIFFSYENLLNYFMEISSHFYVLLCGTPIFQMLGFLDWFFLIFLPFFSFFPLFAFFLISWWIHHLYFMNEFYFYRDYIDSVDHLKSNGISKLCLLIPEHGCFSISLDLLWFIFNNLLSIFMCISSTTFVRFIPNIWKANYWFMP